MAIRGRDTELAVLTKAVDDAISGAGRIVLLSGEAGIGKSRLASETLAHARNQGCTVLQGQAHPLHSGLAYAPIVEALRPHLATVADHDRLADLGRLMADPRLPVAEPLSIPELERTRMFEAVAHLVSHLAPSVLFIDDLHWADRGTVELVHYIGRGARGQKVLVLAAYRPSETLTDLAVGARRDNNEILLGPLPDNAVADLARDLLGAEPSEDTLRGVTTRAKGVPLFVTALVHSRATTLRPDTLPAIIRDVVVSRLHQLDEDERQLVEIVSVAGDSGSIEILQAVWTGEHLDAALRRLVVDGLITEHASGRSAYYRIAHPLYAEVAYAELTMGERRSLHAAIARTIDSRTPDDILALAPHYREAGNLVDSARAVEIIAEAGWRAMAVYDAEEAVQYFEAAVQDAQPELLPPLLEGLGRAHQGCGRLDEAAAAWTKAATLADGRQLASLRHRLALLESERGNATSAWEYSYTGVGKSAPDAAILKMIFMLRHNDAETNAAIVSEMLSFAESDLSPAGQSVACQGAMVQAMFDNDMVKARQAGVQALGHANRCVPESPIQMQSVQRLLVWLAIVAGDLPAAMNHARVGHGQLVQFEIPSAWCSGQFGLAMAHYVSGDLNAALKEINTGERIARSTNLPRSLSRMLLFRSILLAEQGRLGETEACRAEAKRIVVALDISLIQLVQIADTVIALHTGRPENAAPATEWLTFNEPLSCVQPLFAGMTYLAVGDHEKLAETIRNVRKIGRTAPFLDALADRLDGLRTQDAELLRVTADRLDSMGARVLAAQTRLEWAELAGDRGSISQCLETFERAGTAPWLDRCRRHARSLRIRIHAGRKTGLLSNRESQVVQLLGEGLSNADIASRLFLSERTVETHLRNSYAKLGLASRVALARWAAEN